MKLGALLIRAVVGPLFIGHGTQKLFGWFGGHGIEGTGGYFEQLGLKPGQRHARAAGASEAIGGALLTLGLLTPVAASMVIGTMATAIRKAHAQNGPWVTNGGYEYNLVLIAAMAALVESGPGALSADESLFPALNGRGMALTALGAGVAGSFLVTSNALNDAAGGAEEGAGDVAGDPAAANGGAPAEAATTAG
jgi:putative oxidoreductase